MNRLTTMHDLSAIDNPGFKIPLKDGSIYTLSNEMLTAYKDAYPRLDLDDCMRRLVMWNLSNESKRKTKRGILKHINGWLNRQNPAQGQPASTTQRQYATNTSIEDQLNDDSWVKVTQKEYAANTTMEERVKDLSWADGL